MRRRTRLPLAVLVAVAASLAAVGSASAHTAETATQLSMSHSYIDTTKTGDLFTGSVYSQWSGCTVKRSITLYRRLPSSWQAVGTTTNYESRWWNFTTVDANPGERYVAFAARKLIRRTGHVHTCRAAFSGVVTVSGS